MKWNKSSLIGIILCSFGLVIFFSLLPLACTTTLDDFYGNSPYQTIQSNATTATQTSTSTDNKLFSSSQSDGTQSTTIYYSSTISTGALPPTHPQLNIISPGADYTVPSTFMITGTASDDVELIYVEVKIDEGMYQKTMGLTNWSYVFNNITLGTHTVSVRALDNHANETVETITITVNDDSTPPTIFIDSPSYGDWIAGTWDIVCTATDNNAVAKVEIVVDNGIPISATGTDEEWIAQVTDLTDGYHFIEAKAWDYHDNVSMDGIYAQVENNPPTVEIDFPNDGSHVAGIVTISGTAHDQDESGLQRIEVNVEGAGWEPASGTDSWNYNWNTASLAVGSYSFEVRGVDMVNNTSDAISVNVNKSTWANLGPAFNYGSTDAEDANSASITVDDDTGIVYAAWSENDASGVDQIWVKYWDGDSWELVGDLADQPLNVDDGMDARDAFCHWNADDNILDVAWREYDGSYWQIYAKRWNGASWTSLGGSINISATRNAYYPMITHRPGTPSPALITWAEEAGGAYVPPNAIYCKQWGGSAWNNVGPTVESDGNYNHVHPYLAFDGIVPVITYMKDHQYRNYGVCRVKVYKWVDPNWVEMAGELDTSSYAYNPSIAIDDNGNYYVTWSEKQGNAYQVKAKKYTASTTSWGWLGSSTPLNIYPDQHARKPIVALYNNNPYITWYESDSVVDHVYVKKWNEGATDWDLIGQETMYGINVNPLHSAKNPMLFFNAAGTPYVGFNEWDGAKNRIFVKYFDQP
jgi:hypothetical protein